MQIPLDYKELLKILNKHRTKYLIVEAYAVAPVRADIIMGIKGLNFEEAWENRTKTKLEGVKVNIIGLE